MFAWEIHFKDKLLEVRLREAKIIRRLRILWGIIFFLMLITPEVLISSLFITHVYILGNTLNANKIFVALSTIIIIKIPVN